MSYGLKLLPQVEKELLDATYRYEKQNEGLSDKFLKSFEVITKKIVELPKSNPQYEPPFREAYMQNFPFVVIYEIDRKQIIIHSIFHIKQSPNKKYPNH